MEYYTDKLKQATIKLAASSTRLDLEIRNLPSTSSPSHRNAIIAKFKQQHYARRSKIKQDYGVPTPERTGVEEKTFPLLQLPPELQDLIWEFTLPGPRIVPIVRREKYDGLTSPCAPPITLHVCRVSRDVALRSGYELAFLTPAARPAPIYFNFAIDTAYIDHPEALGDLVGYGEPRFSSLDSASRIKNFALGLNMTLVWSAAHSAADCLPMPLLEKYTSLETLFTAAYLCDQALNYGDMTPSRVRDELIPLLGMQAMQWRRMIGNWQGGAGEVESSEKPQQPSIDTRVLLITNSTLRPWVCQKVRNQWDYSLAKILKIRSPEYVLDPAQVEAVAKSKLAVFDSMAQICDTRFAEESYAKLAYNQDHWQNQIRDRLRTHPVSYW